MLPEGLPKVAHSTLPLTIRKKGVIWMKRMGAVTFTTDELQVLDKLMAE